MLVNLKFDWFAPTDREILETDTKFNEKRVVRSRSGRLLRRRDNPHSIPDWMVEHLPTDAEEVDKKLPVDEKVETLRDYDEARIAGKATDTALEKARAALAAKRDKEKAEKVSKQYGVS